MSYRHERLEAARLYLVCGAQSDPFLHAALSGGVAIVQLRMKQSADDEIVTTARRFGRICAEHGALLILNDSPELALAADADGVHIGQDDVSAVQARKLVGPELVVGLSTHSPRQIDSARPEEVDYIGVGPVHATPTKPGRPAVGLELVRYAAINARVPFFAIGGIDPANAEAVRGAGAERIAVVRAITEAVDPRRAARALYSALDRGDSEAHVGTA